MKEGNVLFNDALNTFYLQLYGEREIIYLKDALNTFYLRLYGIRHMVKDHSDSKGRKEMFYLTTHSTHFIYGYMASDIW